MMTILIGVAAFVVLSVEISHENWLAVAVIAGIVLLLIIMAFEERQDGKAEVNRREYWANGGPAQYRQTRQTRQVRRR